VKTGRPIREETSIEQLIDLLTDIEGIKPTMFIKKALAPVARATVIPWRFYHTS
jgi:hypothetical protein